MDESSPNWSLQKRLANPTGVGGMNYWRRGLSARRGTLHLRAPKSAGVYRLYVSANGHTATAAVVVA